MREFITKNKKAIVIACVAILLLTAVATVAIVSFNLQKDLVADVEGSNNGGIIDSNGNSLDDGKVHDLPHSLSFVSDAKTVMLSATILPNSAANKTVDWAVMYVNESDDWASKNNINDYVTIVPSSDGSTVAVLSCLKSFGAQIKIVVTSRENPAATAECTVDYCKVPLYTSLKVVDKLGYGDYEISNKGNVNLLQCKPVLHPQVWFPRYSASINNSDGTNNYSYELTHNYSDEVYSIAPSVTSVKYQIKPHKNFTNIMAGGSSIAHDVVIPADTWTDINYLGYADILIRLFGDNHLNLGGGVLNTANYNDIIGLFSVELYSFFDFKISVTFSNNAVVDTSYSCKYVNGSTAVESISLSNTNLLF